ncbi:MULTISPECIES: acetyl-CoA carboxylase biotin carboxyl carrier protein subunit [Gracilimonas]|uniref:Acetyl-CoA carboxylase biotin carboxyl carrier protein subunit n=1 Tax=Gracilimonas sediminicola TaxID=2952158 RepID=A0A9X2RB15_9BACT|nr:acetyl-CoA carboxylase biotin carboxyl carrier protein subunit [Gracilimonas sediminicola]MCP9290095.1 acetyl-CoA carboxylase biotin carboxyl carrier protein subunit [Gracilimonas sediminicola]
MKFQATIDDNNHDIELSPKDGTFTAGETEANYTFEFVNGRYILRTGTKTYKIDNVSYEGSAIEFSMNGIWHSVEVKDEQELLLDRLGFKTALAADEGILNAPMPGKILEIMVAEGDEVEKDQPLVILEAMKMENELKAPISGTVASISAEVGQSLEKNSPILEIETIG